MSFVPLFAVCFCGKILHDILTIDIAKKTTLQRSAKVMSSLNNHFVPDVTDSVNDLDLMDDVYPLPPPVAQHYLMQ